jgi:hypothetical protein
MSFQFESDGAMVELIAVFGSFWEWNHKTLKGLQSEMIDGNSVEVAGLLPDIEFTVSFRRIEFTNNEIPQAGDIIRDIENNVQHRIISVQTSLTDPSLTVTCASLDGK